MYVWGIIRTFFPAGFSVLHIVVVGPAHSLCDESLLLCQLLLQDSIFFLHLRRSIHFDLFLGHCNWNWNRGWRWRLVLEAVYYLLQTSVPRLVATLIT